MTRMVVVALMAAFLASCALTFVIATMPEEGMNSYGRPQ